MEKTTLEIGKISATFELTEKLHSIFEERYANFAISQEKSDTYTVSVLETELPDSTRENRYIFLTSRRSLNMSKNSTMHPITG